MSLRFICKYTLLGGRQEALGSNIGFNPSLDKFSSQGPKKNITMHCSNQVNFLSCYLIG